MLTVKAIRFSYGEETTIDIAGFSVQKGNMLAVIGESGCGKSTLLKLIYGLYDLDSGSIHWDGKEVLGPKYNLIPGMEYMKYLAQDFDLMPYITVAENVGKYLSNRYPEKKRQRIAALLQTVELSEYANTKAQYLSGGQMQRVALARVLALEPEVLLLDEPFSHIDSFRKSSLRRNVLAYLKANQITTIVATHDSTDVLSFADEVLVMRSGKIHASGTPENLYANPSSYYTASLFGDVNEISIDGKTIFLYPQQLVLTEKSDWEVTVKKSYFRGSDYRIQAEHFGRSVFFDHHAQLPEGAKVYIKINPEKISGSIGINF